MGIQVNAQLEDSEYIRNVQRCIQNVQSNSMLPSAVSIIPFYPAFYRISEIVVERFFSFGHFMPDWMYECTTSGREHKKILKQIHDFTSKVLSTYNFIATYYISRPVLEHHNNS
jgi:hypothetical protein